MDFLKLSGEERAMATARLASELSIVQVQGDENSYAFPIKMLGEAVQVAALIDMCWRQFGNRMAVIVVNTGPAVVRLDPELVKKINQTNGFIEVPTSGEICTLRMEWQADTNKLACYFGYVQSGLNVVRATNGGVAVYFANEKVVEQLVEQSLAKLFKLTGNVKFLQPLAARKILAAQTVTFGQEYVVDPMGYFYILGLNPYLMRYTPPEVVDALVKAAKKGIATVLHPDVSTEDYVEYMGQVLVASDFLLNRENRIAYAKWL